MSMSRKEWKSQKIEEIKSKFKKSKAIISHDFHNIDNENFFLLKNQLRKETKAHYKVFKNSLIKIAFNSIVPQISKKNDLEFNLANGIIFCEGDEYKSLKILENFDQKMDDEKNRMNWGIYEHKFISKETLKKLANLPSKNELLQSFCYVLSYQLIRLLSVLKKIPK